MFKKETVKGSIVQKLKFNYLQINKSELNIIIIVQKNSKKSEPESSDLSNNFSLILFHQ